MQIILIFPKTSVHEIRICFLEVLMYHLLLIIQIKFSQYHFDFLFHIFILKSSQFCLNIGILGLNWHYIWKIRCSFFHMLISHYISLFFLKLILVCECSLEISACLKDFWLMWMYWNLFSFFFLDLCSLIFLLCL